MRRLTRGSASRAAACDGSYGPPAHSVSSFSCRRSCSMPPNTMAPSRPLPTGRASTHCAAGWRYQRVSGLSDEVGDRLSRARRLRRGCGDRGDERAGRRENRAAGPMPTRRFDVERWCRTAPPFYRAAHVLIQAGSSSAIMRRCASTRFVPSSSSSCWRPWFHPRPPWPSRRVSVSSTGRTLPAGATSSSTRRFPRPTCGASRTGSSCARESPLATCTRTPSTRASS